MLSFLSNWGDRHATTWIDDATGLFTGEIAEAYLTAATESQSERTVSIVALTLDRFDSYRSANGEEAAQGVLAQVGDAVRRIPATIGIIAAAYRNGTIILVAPEFGAKSARELGEALHATVSRLRVPSSESVVSNYVTASVAAITGQVKRGMDRVHLLTQAISRVQDAASAGGNRVLALSV